MLIVVNHLTRMKSGYFCAAGINKSKNTHIRPVILYANLSTKLLTCNGGPFDMAALVDLGMVHYHGAAPETEDHIFNPKYTRLVKYLKPDEFWELINAHSCPSLREIFGPDLTQHGQGYVVDCGKGICSLGCLLPSDRPRLYINNYGKIRISLVEGEFQAGLSVTDLRLYEADNETPKKKLVYHVSQRIRDGVKVVLGVGLTRPWKKEGEDKALHWLQVNNIHLEDNPTWGFTSS